MPNPQRVDPWRNFNFMVELDGITQAGFAECSGFGSTTEPVDYNEGGLNRFGHKFVGRTKQNNLTLKWGLTSSRQLYDWYQAVVNGNIQRKNGSIIMLDLEGQEQLRWNFFNAWPTKWDGPDFNAKNNEVAIETLEIAHEGIERV